MDILGISCVISWEYLGDILGISWGISWGYLGDILGDILGISSGYLGDLLDFLGSSGSSGFLGFLGFLWFFLLLFQFHILHFSSKGGDKLHYNLFNWIFLFLSVAFYAPRFCWITLERGIITRILQPQQQESHTLVLGLTNYLKYPASTGAHNNDHCV